MSLDKISLSPKRNYFTYLRRKFYWLVVTWHSLDTLRVRHQVGNIKFRMISLMELIVVVFQIIVSKSHLRALKQLNIADSITVFLFFLLGQGEIQSAFTLRMYSAEFY